MGCPKYKRRAKRERFQLEYALEASGDGYGIVFSLIVFFAVVFDISMWFLRLFDCVIDSLVTSSLLFCSSATVSQNPIKRKGGRH